MPSRPIARRSFHRRPHHAEHGRGLHLARASRGGQSGPRHGRNATRRRPRRPDPSEGRSPSRRVGPRHFPAVRRPADGILQPVFPWRQHPRHRVHLQRRNRCGTGAGRPMPDAITSAKAYVSRAIASICRWKDVDASITRRSNDNTLADTRRRRSRHRARGRRPCRGADSSPIDSLDQASLQETFRLLRKNYIEREALSSKRSIARRSKACSPGSTSEPRWWRCVRPLSPRPRSGRQWLGGRSAALPAGDLCGRRDRSVRCGAEVAG